MENNMEVKKLKIELLYNPVMSLLGTYPKDCAPGYDRATYTPTLSATPFATAKLWKHPDAPQLMNGLRKCGVYVCVCVCVCVCARAQMWSLFSHKEE
jgi:hypothetical protein